MNINKPSWFTLFSIIIVLSFFVLWLIILKNNCNVLKEMLMLSLITVTHPYSGESEHLYLQNLHH